MEIVRGKGKQQICNRSKIFVSQVFLTAGRSFLFTPTEKLRKKERVTKEKTEGVRTVKGREQTTPDLLAEDLPNSTAASAPDSAGSFQSRRSFSELCFCSGNSSGNTHLITFRATFSCCEYPLPKQSPHSAGSHRSLSTQMSSHLKEALLLDLPNHSLVILKIVKG